MSKSSNRNKKSKVLKYVSSDDESEQVKRDLSSEAESEKDDSNSGSEDDVPLVKSGKSKKAAHKKAGSAKKTSKNAGKEEEAEKKDEDSEVEQDDEPLVKRGMSKKTTPKKTGSAKKTSKKVDKKEDVQSDEEEAEYEVEEIVAHKMQRNKILYRIRWKNYESGDDTWEPEETLSCPDLIKKYKGANPDTEKPVAKKRGPSGKKTHSKAKTTKLDEATDSDEPECDGKDWEVQKIVDVHYNRNGSREFLVRWTGYKPSDDTWEPEEHLECPDLIEKFMSKVEESKNASQKELRTQPKHTDRYTLMDQTKGRRLSRRHDGQQRAVYYDAE